MLAQENQLKSGVSVALFIVHCCLVFEGDEELEIARIAVTLRAS